MRQSNPSVLSTVALVTAVLGLSACATDAHAPVDDATASFAHVDGVANRQLGELRRVTSAFHDYAAAAAAGYTLQFPAGCMEIDEGAQGYHFIDMDRVGTLDPLSPQLLMYEPQANGRLNLVGVEYIFPGSSTDDPPVLFGREFGWSEVFGVWVLHVWAWRGNPDRENGIFANWNRNVSCRYAQTHAPAGTRHH